MYFSAKNVDIDFQKELCEHLKKHKIFKLACGINNLKLQPLSLDNITAQKCRSTKSTKIIAIRAKKFS